jgi:hypothetical protein
MATALRRLPDEPTQARVAQLKETTHEDPESEPEPEPELWLRQGRALHLSRMRLSALRMRQALRQVIQV